MSERFVVKNNTNDSKATRLPIRQEFAQGRFNRDALAHVSRYLWIMERIERLADDLQRPVSILDIGCGDAYIMRVLNRTSKRQNDSLVSYYTGVDIDERRVTATREELSRWQTPTNFVVEDLTVTGLAGWDQHDVVICLEVLEHIQPHYVAPTLKRFAEIAAHRAFISTPNWPGGSGRLPKDHIKEWDHEAELVPAMLDAGLCVIDSVGTFCQLSHAKRLAKAGATVHLSGHDIPFAPLYEEFRRAMDKDFASLALARLMGTKSQNLLYECSTPSSASVS